MKRFKLQDHRKFWSPANFMFDDVAGDFFRQRKRKTHKLYRTMAIWVPTETSPVMVGALEGGSLRIKPGKKKLAGETVVPALTPLQPLTTAANATNIASHMNFQFNLTRPV